MHRTFLPALLVLPLVGACSGSEESSTPDDAYAASDSQPAAPSEAQPAPSEIASGATPEPSAADPGTGTPPAAKDVEHDFTPGGPIADADLGSYYVEMQCAIDGADAGTMTFELWPQHAPVTVRNFLRYCAEGFYDGLTFHRVMRDFMIQGGDPQGTGAGAGTYGNIVDEFSDDPDRGHHYGVISMAHSPMPNSASSQFFVCNAETANVWGLDGGYASFGRLAGGVAALEALSDVPVTRSPRGEPSQPTKKVTISSTRVVKGEPERTETIERPKKQLDLGGEPEMVSIQHVLISFDGVPRTGATRTREEAEALAASILEQAKGGADFKALVLEHSDDPFDESDPTPGVYKLTNHGVLDEAGERAMFEANSELVKLQQELIAQQRAGTLSQEEAQAKMREGQADVMLRLDGKMSAPRDGMAPAFGDVGFALEVGEVGMTTFDPQKSPFGWHVIKRLE
ncbi:MAG: peptidylprolyl isomerase [Planctomycetota bacterium]